jgi:hypothetical protein
MDSYSRRYHFGAGWSLSAAPLGASLVIAAVLSLVCPVLGGTPGTAGDTTAGRELGQIDFSHTMFDFGGAAAFSGPVGVAIDTSGHLYVSDSINNRVRDGAV